MKKYTPPKKEFLMLPNSVFDMPLDVYAFKIYAYLVCCAGSRGECWPTMHKMSKKLGIAMSTVQDRISLLEKRKLIAIKKRRVIASIRITFMFCCLMIILSSTGIWLMPRNCPCSFDPVSTYFATQQLARRRNQMTITDSHPSFGGLWEITTEVRKVYHTSSEIWDSHTVRTVSKTREETYQKPPVNPVLAPCPI